MYTVGGILNAFGNSGGGGELFCKAARYFSGERFKGGCRRDRWWYRRRCS